MGTSTTTSDMVAASFTAPILNGTLNAYDNSAATGLMSLKVPVVIVNGASAGTFALPAGAKVTSIECDTGASAVAGTPTNVNLRLGSAANGQQYVSDVDIKAAGGLNLTLVAAARSEFAAASTWHYTVASSGGTAADQDATVQLYVQYRPAAT